MNRESVGFYWISWNRNKKRHIIVAGILLRQRSICHKHGFHTPSKTQRHMCLTIWTHQQWNWLYPYDTDLNRPKGLCKEFVFQKSEFTMKTCGWIQVLLGILCVENHPKIDINRNWYVGIVYHVYSVCIQLLVIMIWVFCPCQWWVSKKSLDGGWVGGVSSIQVYFAFLELIKLCKAPII